MKFTLPHTAKPRNPLVPLAMKRRAGAHGIGESRQRQLSRQALRRELQHLKDSP
jgi:hypothetical protein